MNDAFGTAHRAHASTEGAAHLLPSAAGFLIEKEIKYLSEAVNNPRKPLVAIMGGSKVKDKIALIENLIGKLDRLLIGGGMAYTFLKAQGLEIGKSLLDAESIDYSKKLLNDHPDKLVLLTDTVVTKELRPDATTSTVKSNEISADELGRISDQRPASSSEKTSKARGPSCGMGQWGSSR